MAYRIEVETEDPWPDDIECHILARVLRRLADRVEAREYEGDLFDDNGRAAWKASPESEQEPTLT